MKQLEVALSSFESMRGQLNEEQVKKYSRQAELSVVTFQSMKSLLQEKSVMITTTTSTTDEKLITADIDFLVKKMAFLDEHIKKLKLARYHLEQRDKGSYEQAEKLLKTTGLPLT